MDCVMNSPSFNQALETVESLPLEDQEMLLDIMRQRLIQRRRESLASDIQEAREDYLKGDVQRGTVSDLMKELEG